MILHIRLRRDSTGYPPFESEEVTASEVGDRLHRLAGTPAFASGLAVGDTVRVAHFGGDRWVDQLVEPSGHSTVRVVALGSNSLDRLHDELIRTGCEVFPTPVPGVIAVDIPAPVPFDSVRSLLQTGRDSGAWDFDIGLQAHKR